MGGGKTRTEDSSEGAEISVALKECMKVYMLDCHWEVDGPHVAVDWEDIVWSFQRVFRGLASFAAEMVVGDSRQGSVVGLAAACHTEAENCCTSLSFQVPLAFVDQIQGMEDDWSPRKAPAEGTLEAVFHGSALKKGNSVEWTHGTVLDLALVVLDNPVAKIDCLAEQPTFDNQVVED